MKYIDYLNSIAPSKKRGEELLKILNIGPGYLETMIILEESVRILDLPNKTYKALSSSKIQTIGELITTPDTEILKIKNLRETSLEDINKELAKFNLELYQYPYPRKFNDPRNKESGYIPILEESIYYLGLSSRTINALRKYDINIIGELINYSKIDFLQIRGMGKASAEEIEEKLKIYKLKLYED